MKEEQILTKTDKSFELLDNLEDYINHNFRLITSSQGTKMSLEEIRSFFRVIIPEDISFPILVNLAREINEKYQRATYLRDKQKVKLALVDQTRIEKYNDAYQLAREETKREMGKPLAAKSCEVQASIATRILENSVNTQQVIYNFWDGICKTLVETRKHIEIISIALSGDAKIQRDFIIKGNNND